MRYEVTKGEAEKILQFADELKAHGMTFMGYSIGRKCYTREFFEAVRDRGGFVIHEEPLTVEQHIVVAPANGIPLPPDNSYMGMVNTVAREITGSRP